MKIDSWKILRSLTSGRTVGTDGYLTLNHITKLVLVEYTPLPSLTVQDGSFNLNLIMEFNPPALLAAGASTDELKSLLEDLSYNCYVLEQLTQGEQPVFNVLAVKSGHWEKFPVLGSFSLQRFD